MDYYTETVTVSQAFVQHMTYRALRRHPSPDPRHWSCKTQRWTEMGCTGETPKSVGSDVVYKVQ